MGVNVVALIPYKGINENTEAVIRKIFEDEHDCFQNCFDIITK